MERAALQCDGVLTRIERHVQAFFGPQLNRIFAGSFTSLIGILPELMLAVNKHHRLNRKFWTPAFARMTLLGAFYEVIILSRKQSDSRLLLNRNNL